MATEPIDCKDLGEVTVLRKPDGTGYVYILGTCHVSSSSASAAGELVRRVQPSAVVLELCEGRRGLLDPAEDDERSSPPTESASVIGSLGSLGSVATDWTELIKMQYSALDDLAAPKAGGEFRAAAREAEKIGAKILLADRRIATTTLRLKRLVPATELALTMLFDDSEWLEKQALERHTAMLELRATSGSLSEALRQPHSPEREERLNALAASLSSHSERAVEASIPGFTDAVVCGLLRRFWYKEIIGESDKARLRSALNDMHRIDPLSGGGLPNTMRRILITERDTVLAHAMKTAAGSSVVGVVGKAHVAGITEQWERDTAALLPAALEEPRPSLTPLLALVAGGIGLPAAAYRWRPVRIGLGVTTLAGLGGATWLAAAISDRLAFFQRTQREQQLR